MYLLGFWCCFCVVTIESLSAEGRQVSFPRIIGESAFSNNGLHIIGVDSDNDQSLRWVTWGNRSKKGMTTVLVLLKKGKTESPVLWSREFYDCYEPNLIRLTGWQYGQHPIVALTYRYGALAEQVEIYGLDKKNRPVKIGEEFGEAIEWSINSSGERLMNVYSKPEGQIVPTCYGWDNHHQQLKKVECAYSNIRNVITN